MKRMGIIISRLFKVSFVRRDEAEFMYMHRNYIVFEALYILGLLFDKIMYLILKRL